MTALVLTSGPCRLVATTDGGGLLEFSSNGRHILRLASQMPADPLDRAMIVMAPWCNRIGGGGFYFGKVFYPLAANLPPFPLPLHGNAFQNPWQVRQLQTDFLSLALSSPGPSGFYYCAEINYRLGRSGLDVDLTVTNRGQEPMPFAIGLHPWFTTTETTTLRLAASGQLATDACGLPVRATVLEPSFCPSAPLPQGRIDNTLLGWEGLAVLDHTDFTVELRSSAPYLHLFYPDRRAGFCCLEPQTAPPNAVNSGAYPAKILAANEQLSLGMSVVFRW